MFMIQREDEEAAELLQARAEIEHQSRVFAADIPNRWAIYRLLYEDKSPEDEYDFVEEVNPENEKELRKAYLDMKRAGFEFAED